MSRPTKPQSWDEWLQRAIWGKVSRPKPLLHSGLHKMAFVMLLCALPACATTWFSRSDGGNRYQVTDFPYGLCNGTADAAYPGTTNNTWGAGQVLSLNYEIVDANGNYEKVTTAGTAGTGSVPSWPAHAAGGSPTTTDGTTVWTYQGAAPFNQSCAYNAYTLLYNDGAIGNWGWVISSGDTVVIRGCKPSPVEQNPSSPNCRVGWLNNQSNSLANPACWFAPGGYGSNFGCYNPVIPAGSSGAHTRILGGWAYDHPGSPVAQSDMVQIFSGFGDQVLLDLSSTQYVDVAGLELTTHNSAHCNQYGTPAFTHTCSNSVPGADDFGNNGIQTNNTTAHVTMTDVNIHGFTAAGLYGPIGGAINMTRVSVNYNGFAGWNFADVSNTPDAAGSTLIGSYVTMIGNGCIEEYPITHALPMLACWDSDSGGFGDAWSGQDTDLDTFSCDHCVTMYNTKDGDIGPHTRIRIYTKTNSISAFNMGQQWKWGSGGSTPQTVDFENNLTVSGCQRMSQPLTGAPSTYNTNLSLFCRAAGDVMSPNISPGSTWKFANNTFVFNALTLLDVQCYPGGMTCTSTINWFNNAIIGYQNIPTVYGMNVPAVFFNQSPGDITINSTFGVEFGIRNGSTCGGNIHCVDPLFLNEPAQSVTTQSALDVFTNTPSTSSFYPAGGSPMIAAGTTGGPGTDYFGVTYSVPPPIGAVMASSPPPSGGTSVSGNVTFSGSISISGGP